MIHLAAIVVASSLLFPSMRSGLAQEQQWLTYENPQFGITIQHPSDWEVVSSNTDSSPPPEGFAKEIVVIDLKPKAGRANSDTQSLTLDQILDPFASNDGRLAISVQVTDSYLDTDTMQVKNASLESFVEGKRQEVVNSKIGVLTGDTSLRVDEVRSNYTTIGGIPAWQMENVVGGSNMGEQLLYTVDTLLMKDNHLYSIEFLTDPLKAPEILPIAHRMIDSFRITTPTQPPLTASPDTTDPSQQFNMRKSINQTELAYESAEQNKRWIEGMMEVPYSEVPKVLIVTDNKSGDNSMPLRSAIINGKITNLDLSDSSKGKLNDRQPNVTFQFTESVPVKTTQIITGPIRSYDSPETILEDAHLRSNVPIYKPIALEIMQPGLNYLIASVQFSDSISGVYSTVIDVQTMGQKSSGKDFLVDKGAAIEGMDDLEASNLESSHATQQVISMIICSDLASYGFEIC